MTITEVAVLKLAKPSTRAELADLPQIAGPHKTVSSQPGCKGAWWDVVEGDSSRMVWMVEWDALSDHQAFEKADVYQPFRQALGEILDKESGIEGMFHFDFSPAPFDRIMTADYPVLSIFVGEWKSGSTPSDYVATFKGVIDQFDKDGQPWRVAASIDVQPELKNTFCALLAVESSKEHEKRQNEELFQSVFKEGGQMITGFKFRGYAIPRP